MKILKYKDQSPKLKHQFLKLYHHKAEELISFINNYEGNLVDQSFYSIL